MDILKARELIKYQSINELPLRVAYYARVSTEKDEQLNSLKNQQIYYENYINNNINWTLVRGYIDEGISAITTKNRENFHRMIEDACNNEFDFIITKEISRFARNTLDSIQYTRLLLTKGVGVFFQNDNINTLDEDSEFRLTIMAGVAQDEVRKLSSRVKFGHKQAIKNGVVMGNSRIYGYEKNKGKLVVNEKEAEMVKMIFELYATGEYSTPKLEKLLWEKGYRNYNGGKINRGVIGHIITNPKYKGYYVGNKVKIIDMFNKTQKFLDEEDWVMWKDNDGDTVPAIIDEETWNTANFYFRRVSENIKSRKCTYKADNLFTGKIFCAEHNVPYYLKARKNRKGEDNASWVCSHKLKYGSQSCKSIYLREKELIEIVKSLLMSAYNNFDELIDIYMKCYKESFRSEDYSLRIEEIDKSIEKINSKKDKLLELSLEGDISNSEFAVRNERFNDEIRELESKKREYISRQNNSGIDTKNLMTIRDTIKEYLINGDLELTRVSVDKMIDRIYVQYVSDRETEISVILRTNQKSICQIYPESKENNVLRHVNTFKKMIEEQEKKMANREA